MIDKIEEFFLEILEKIKLKKIADLYRKYREGMRYLIFGVLTTIVNIIIYSVLYYCFNIFNGISNVIAWILSATFAYITNKLWVFNSNEKSVKGLTREIISFYGCRLFTLGIDEAIMIITVDKFCWNALLMKILANVIVIILNYVFSKILIFRKKDKKV